MGAVTWDCPRCRRRVPLRVQECHCGMRQDAARRAVIRERSHPARRGVPLQVWIWGGVMGLALVAGLVWLFVAPRPAPIVPVLGYVDRGAPANRPPATLAPRRR